MKKILLTLAILASATFAGAQPKSHQAAKSAVESALEASQNPKKALKYSTWIKLAEAYTNAYKAPMANIWTGAGQNEVKLIMGSEKPMSETTVELQGQSFLKQTFADKDLYFNANGVLTMIDVTMPVFQEDVLAKSIEAWQKAASLDEKGKKLKDIKAGISKVSTLYQEQAYNAYTKGDFSTASKFFGLAADASAAEPNCMVDSLDTYNAGFTAWASGENEIAADFFQKCLDMGYYYEDGEVFAKLGDLYSKLGKGDKSVEVLERGFKLYPGSQSILIGLINYYIESNSNTNRLFELLAEAKNNEPNNASLYYVEGNIHSQLGDALIKDGKEEEGLAEKTKAVEAYLKSSEINPEYEYGFIGAGILYYNLALIYQDKAANEFDDAKYQKLVSKFEETLEKAIAPFEQGFTVTKQNDVKVSLAEYLKNIYYRFSTKGAEYEAKYNTYNEIVKTGNVQ